MRLNVQLIKNIVDCTEMKEEPYIGIPAPAYLEDDEWFGPAPVRTEKQLDYMVQEMEIKRQERKKISLLNQMIFIKGCMRLQPAVLQLQFNSILLVDLKIFKTMVGCLANAVDKRLQKPYTVRVVERSLL